MKIYTTSVAIWMCIIAAVSIIAALFKKEKPGEGRKWKHPWLSYFLAVIAVSSVPVFRLIVAIGMIQSLAKERENENKDRNGKAGGTRSESWCFQLQVVKDWGDKGGF